VGNAAEGTKAVLTVKEMGSDFIKVYSMLPRDAYFAMPMSKATKHGSAGIGSFISAEASDAGQSASST
jgi:hypothetical protein